MSIKNAKLLIGKEMEVLCLSCTEKESGKSEKAGEYKYLTQGAMNVGEMLLVFSLFTYEPDIQFQDMVLTMLQTAIHKFQRNI